MPSSSRDLPRRPVNLRSVSLSRALEAADISETAVAESALGPTGLGAHVTGVTHDSRLVRPGDLYAALPGEVTHGARFTAEAVSSGAAAVLTDDAGVDLVRRLVIDVPAIPIVSVENLRGRLGAIAAEIYGHPARDLLMIGITGTNGKTTTAYLVEAALRAAGHVPGLIGTVESRVGDRRAASARTTPESPDLHALLAVMREEGATACAMEVSSHALVFGRVDGVTFDVAGFTNLSQDHLDFHNSLDDYFAAKVDLFTPGRARRGVACVTGDAADYGRRLVAEAAIPVVPLERVDSGRVVTGGSPMWTVSDARDAPSGHTWARLTTPKGLDVDLDVPLPGDFNVANAALAVAMLAEAGVDVHVAADGVATCAGVPGRMERITPSGASGTANDLPLAILDYAHTPDAIQNVLGALPRSDRVIAVVGAGGDRDPHKRPLMGQAAAAGADVVIVTDDNPRSEDPAAIRAAIVEGTTRVPSDVRAEVRELPRRAEAIKVAVSMARGPSDIVVVLGKGHEQGQEIGGTVHAFDDAAVLLEQLTRHAQ